MCFLVTSLKISLRSKIQHSQRVSKQDGPNFSHAHTTQTLLKSVRSEGICLKADWSFQICSTEDLFGLLCLKAKLKHLHFVFSLSVFHSLGSRTAFKNELQKNFKHLIWHQGKNSSVDGKEAVRKKKVFLVLDWKYKKTLGLVRYAVIQHVFCCEMTSVGWGWGWSFS